jgi:pimeloyl-ACP methyl ester carboxylesterase
VHIVRSPARGAAAALCGLAAVAGCQFGALRENLRVLDRYGYVRGTVTPSTGATAAPLVVFAVPVDGSAAADWVVLPRQGPYFLAVPVGQYRVGAFEDDNHSLVHDPGEAVVWARGGAPIEVRPGSTIAGLDLALGVDTVGPPVTAELLSVRSSGDVDELPGTRIGEVVTLDDARFSDEAARVGLWRPVEFLEDYGAGIYFLEPYDPKRTPVLFVHGALGHPGNFQVLISRLDHRRYQAWVAYYPSAVRLEKAGAALGRWLQALEVEYGFHRIGVVAHSMGGLVARAYLNHDPDGLGATIDSLTFVSIATPWQGHEAAARGVSRAPVVAPSWFDMAPNSPFLTWLLDTPLPRYAAYDLYFAYGGSRRSRIANDGVVTVAAQLDLRAQQRARLVVGFDDQHRAVLDDPTVGDYLQRSLAGIAPP